MVLAVVCVCVWTLILSQSHTEPNICGPWRDCGRDFSVFVKFDACRNSNALLACAVYTLQSEPIVSNVS